MNASTVLLPSGHVPTTLHCSGLQHGITMDDTNTQVFLQRVFEQLNALDTGE